MEKQYERQETGKRGSSRSIAEKDSSSSSSIHGALCEECLTNTSKYKCPGCGFRSCSLDCVKAHKRRTSCSGKRDRTSFIPLTSFNDNNLVSDYNLLEEILTQSNSAKRYRDLDGQARQNLGVRWILLRKQASKRKINLLYLAQGMTRRIDNSSRFCKRRNRIFWRIEWLFHSTDATLVDTGADENLSPAKMLENKLMKAQNSSSPSPNCKHIKQVSIEGAERMRFFCAKEFCSSEDKGYIELDPLEPLGSQLTTLTIIEFPTILVVPPHCELHFSISRNLIAEKAMEEVLNGKEVIPTKEVEGIPFREEEIEEGEILD